MASYDQVREDFHAIAQLPEEPQWNHNNCYLPYLLKRLPARLGTCLEIGCGQGELAALLAQRAERVIAVDLAEEMSERARARNTRENISYRCGNLLDMDLPDASLDLIITTAAAHRLPFRWLLELAGAKLRPGGQLVILAIVKLEILLEKLLWGFAVIANFCMPLPKNRRPFPPG